MGPSTFDSNSKAFLVRDAGEAEVDQKVCARERSTGASEGSIQARAWKTVVGRRRDELVA